MSGSAHRLSYAPRGAYSFESLEDINSSIAAAAESLNTVIDRLSSAPQTDTESAADMKTKPNSVCEELETAVGQATQVVQAKWNFAPRAIDVRMVDADNTS
jgi:hypothetical protein